MYASSNRPIHYIADYTYSSNINDVGLLRAAVPMNSTLFQYHLLYFCIQQCDKGPQCDEVRSLLLFAFRTIPISRLPRPFTKNASRHATRSFIVCLPYRSPRSACHRCYSLTDDPAPSIPIIRTALRSVILDSFFVKSETTWYFLYRRFASPRRAKMFHCRF